LYTGALPERVARMYFRQLIGGIEYMHSKGVYHRDLKLENIVLSETLELKIADFGSSMNISDLKGKKTFNHFTGTAKY
jgi:serine/threonine protein kinase